MRSVVFLDTSVVCNIVPVPGFAQDTEKVLMEMAARMEEGSDFIPPITSVVETGNQIAQLPDGNQRRTAAQRFSDLLQMVIGGRARWILHDIPWNKNFLERFLAGAGTCSWYVQHAVNKVGAGDLCILTEREQYVKRTGLRATVWTVDAGLDASNQNVPPPAEVQAQ